MAGQSIRIAELPFAPPSPLHECPADGYLVQTDMAWSISYLVVGALSATLEWLSGLSVATSRVATELPPAIGCALTARRMRGAVAQRESTCFASRGSRVRIPPAPPASLPYLRPGLLSSPLVHIDSSFDSNRV